MESVHEPLSESGMTDAAGSPRAIARDALRQLAAMRMPPTPDNFARTYYEIALPGRPHPIGDALSALQALSDDLTAKGAATADIGVALRHALHGGDWPRVRTLILDTIASGASRRSDHRGGKQEAAVSTEVWTKATRACRDLLADALCGYVGPDLGFEAELVHEAASVARDIRAATTPETLQRLDAAVHALLVKTGRANRDHCAIQQALLRLLDLLCANVTEVVGDGSWISAQMEALAELTQGKLTLKAIADLEVGLRDISARQGTLKQSLEQAKDAMKQMVATFIERLGELASNAGGYHDRLASYCTEIEHAKDVGQLSSLIVRIMEDTRGVQLDLGRSREELLAARRAVEQFQERTNRLESELVMLSDRLQEDQLTRVLNRRGLTRAFAREASRADRHRRALSLAMLDIDDFKALNDRFGHQAGDSALVHVTETLRASLRVSDLIARYGGDELVVLLPETELDAALHVLQRVQSDLNRNPFQHGGRKVPITFSAGVAERVTGETEEALIARADAALYDAKKEGKNLVLRK